MSSTKQKRTFKKVASGVLATSLLLTPLTPFNVIAAIKSNPSKPKYSVKATRNVNSLSEFESALSDPSVTDITLNTSIVLKKALIVGGTTKNIHGNGYAINASNTYYIPVKSAGTSIFMENVTVVNTSLYGIVGGTVNCTVTFKNVNHLSGIRLARVTTGHVILDGTVTSNSDNITYGNIQTGNLTVKSNANVKLNAPNTTDRSNGASIYSTLNNANYLVERGAKLTIRSKGSCIITAEIGGNKSTLTNYGEIDVHSITDRGIRMFGWNTPGTGGIINLEKGSKTKAVTDSANLSYTEGEEAIEATTGSIYLRSGATLEAESKGRQGTLITGENLVFEKGSNFHIINRGVDKTTGEPNGSVVGSYSRPSVVSIASDEGAQFVGATENFEQNFNCPGSFSTKFTISGYFASTMTQEKFSAETTNTNFKQWYYAGYTVELTGGNLYNAALAPTTINNLNTNSTIVTGTAEPYADVSIKVGTKEIGKGKATSSGSYNIQIPKQAFGTRVSAQAAYHTTIISNVAETTVTQADLAATTLNGLTTHSETATGKAEPYADVSIKVGTKEIGKGTANAAGAYSVAIPKQAFGTKVTAQATLNGKTSNIAETTVTQADLALTTLDDLTTHSETATGTAEPYADVSIKVGTKEIGKGAANAAGEYSIAIPKQSVGTNVTAQATLNGKTSNVAETIVTEEFSGELEFKQVPANLPFEQSEITANTKLIPRQDPNWAIQIENGIRVNWQLKAEASPVQDENNKAYSNALIFKNENGDINDLAAGQQVIASGDGTHTSPSVDWASDKGILFRYNPGTMLARTYSSTVTFTLENTPSVN